MNVATLFFAATLIVAALVGTTIAQDRPAAPASATANVAPPAAPIRPIHATHADHRLYEALDRRVTFDFQKKPLSEVADYLRTTLAVPVAIDEKALAAEEFDNQLPITAAARDAKLIDALQTICKPNYLGFKFSFGTLLFTTAEAEYVDRQDLRVYPVHDLVVRKNDPMAAFPDFEPLIDVIERSCAPFSWHGPGPAPGRIGSYAGPGILALAIIQTPAAHHDIDELLSSLRAARTAEVEAVEASLPPITSRTIDYGPNGKTTLYPGPPPPARLPAGKAIRSTSAREEAIHAALDNPAQLERKRWTLAELRTAVEQRHKIPVYLDARELEADGRDEQFTIEVAGDAPLYDVLQFALRSVGMTIVVRHERLEITSTTRAADDDAMSTRPYQVHDLVLYGREADGPRPDFIGLLELIQTVTQPDDYGEGGYGGTNLQSEIPGAQVLVSRHTELVHKDIERLLKMLRAAYSPELHAAQRRQPVDLPPGVTLPAKAGGMGGGMF